MCTHAHTNTHMHTQVKLYNEKRRDLEEQQLHLNVGLQKIRETVDQVEELQASLSIKKAELQQKNDLANQKLKQMVSLCICVSTVIVHHTRCDYLHVSVITTTTLVGKRPAGSGKEEGNLTGNPRVACGMSKYLLYM